jgi:hypothetical protein
MLKVLSHWARIGDHAAAATDAGIVEQQVDAVRLLLLDQLIAEADELLLDRGRRRHGW